MPRHTLSVVSFLALPLLFAGCSSPNSAAPAAGGGRGGRGAGGPVPVLTARVEQKPMLVTLPAVGTVEAISSVQIRAQVTGQLSTIHFAEGQDVQKGQPLFTLDPRPFQASLQQAEAVLARDAATLQNAQAQQARVENLFQRGLVPRDQLETQRASAAALAATVAADKAAVETARLNLQYTDIRAPMTGRTGGLLAHVGDLIRANDTNPLVVINQLAPAYVTFSVPGRFLTEIRRYQARRPLGVIAGASSATQPSASGGGPVTPGATPSAGAPASGVPARVDASEDVPAAQARGVVTFIDNAVDPTTGTIRLKATFPNTEHQLWPGAFVQVSLQLRTDADAIVVPATAVQVSQDGQFVYVVKADRTVEMRPIQLERQQGNEAVIANGVNAGEEVVTDGHLRLTPGARVSERGAQRGGAGQGGERGGRGEGGAAGRGARTQS